MHIKIRHKTLHQGNVQFTVAAEKQYNNLKRNGSKPSIVDIINLLAIEMKQAGPYRSNWANYSPLKGEDSFHCHLKKGKPTYLACWKVTDKKKENN